MKQKINFKNSNGITLIALVVTIVILLILAAISINAVIGENGLISKARDAKTKTEQDKVNTEIALNNLYDEMLGILGENGNGSSDTDDLGQPNIGDYVNYTYDTVADGYSLLSTQSGYGSNQTVAQSATTLQWRILNIDKENGTIDLVSAATTDNKVFFQGALGYNNGVYLLNDMCSALYSNSSLGITARSINLADMEKHLTTDGFAARNAYVSSSSQTGKKYGETYPYTTNRYYPNLYANQLGAGIDLAADETVTQPNTDGTIDPYNESNPYYTTPTTDTYTPASTSLTVTQTYYYIPINETNYGEAASVLSNSYYFWVASRFANADDSGDADFGLRYANTSVYGTSLFYSSRGTISINYRLRPVVSLSSSLLDGTKDASGAWNLISAE